MSKTLQELDSKEFVKLTNNTHACNSLTNFEYEAHTFRKRKSSESTETCLGKIREITSGELIFGGF